MELRGIDFEPVFCASGAMGFFGEGYWYHKLFRPFGLNFSGCAFVAKTTTLEKRIGNMPLQKDGITPKEWIPKCIKVYPAKSIVLNAVGLSGPGAKALFDTGRWQERTEPFFLSFMSVAKALKERMLELERFVNMFKEYLSGFQLCVGLQMNYSCPNVGLNPDELIWEIKTGLEIASVLGIPLVPKLNVLVAPEIAKEILDDQNCDGLCISNTIPFGKLSGKINWKKLFGSEISPLAEFGGGGLSGKPLLPLVAEWVRKAREIGIEKPIIAGGGILSARDAISLFEVGASAVSLGSIAMLRPWRVRKVVRAVNQPRREMLV